MNPMKNDEEGDNPLITLRKSDIQDMIDEEADSLRDDVEASIHALQVDFLRQMQRQSDEVAAMLAHNQQEMQQLSIQNQELNKENERLRKFFWVVQYKYTYTRSIAQAAHFSFKAVLFFVASNLEVSILFS